MAKTIMGIDPGGTTGICIFENPDVYKLLEVKKDLSLMYKMIEVYKPDHVVFERFVLYPSAAKGLIYDDFYTSQVIGVIKLACEHFGIPYSEQAARDKDFVDYKDRKFPNDHIKDAYGHAWYYYTKEKFKGSI